MSMNTSVNTTPVTTINPSVAVNGNTNKIVSPNTTSQFQPEAQVDIQNSLKSLLTSLEKTSAKTDIPLESLPPEVQKIVNSLLKNAFSLEASLGKGLSDVLQNQKLTLEQLGALAKLLEQAANLSSSSVTGNLSDGLKALLQNMNLVDKDGKLFDNISLNKLSLQLLEGKNCVELAELLQLLIAQSPGSVINNTAMQGDSMQFLKQLVQYFMPSNGEENTTQSGSQTKQNFTNQGPMNNSGQSDSVSSQTTKQSAQTNTNTAGTNSATTNANQATNAQNSSVNVNQQQSGTTTSTPNQTLLQNSSASNNQSTIANPQSPANLSANGQNADNANQTSINQTNNSNKQMALEQNQPMNNLPGKANQQTSAQLQTGDVKQAQINGKETLLQQAKQTVNKAAVVTDLAKQTIQPMQNNPVMLQVLKNLASQLLAKQTLPEDQLAALRNFINGDQAILKDSEVQELQKLVQAVTENIPQTIQLAAAKQNIPDLPKLWAFVQLCNLTKLLEISSERLRNSGKNINDFALIMKRAMQNENEVAGNQRSMSFMTPLYMGDPEKYYPTYIHIYDENSRSLQDGSEQKETWLRLCLLTENIGAVEVVFRLYEKNNINLKVAFSAAETAENFTGYIPELKEAFANLPLTLNDIKVSAIGEDNG